MADESEDDSAKTGTAAEPAVIAAALGAATPEARDYLRLQSRLTGLQIEQLEKSDAFETSHLRFRRLNELGKFALQLAAGLVVLLAVAGLATMVLNAAHDRSMVVEAFSVPPDVAATGMTGSVLANRLIDQFGKLQSRGVSVSQGNASYRRDSGDGIRVEIPETGISIGELDRYLRGWLGHQTHVGGDLVHAAKGYSLTVRYGDAPGTPLANADINTLLTQGAEQLMAQAVPYHYVEYLARQRRTAEALALAPALASSGSNHDRARGFGAWATVYFRAGNMWDAANTARKGLTLEPRNPSLLAWAGSSEGNLVHEEASQAYSAAIPAHLSGAMAEDMAPEVVSVLPSLFAVYHKEVTGDLLGAIKVWEAIREMGNGGFDPGGLVTDIVLDHDLARARRIFATTSLAELDQDGQFTGSVARMLLDVQSDDWHLAAQHGADIAIRAQARPEVKWTVLFYAPVWAYATAQAGDLAKAEAIIAPTPLDCDACARARGRIAAVKHDWAGAERWFAMVSARSPHVPFADTDWGEMLLTKGDLDGAITHFAIAHQRGPNFADPLEMWGEALMGKNHSDQALPKFAEAAKDAPQWGRLYLKWGEALVYAGQPDEAKAQFAQAAKLALTIAEKSELNRYR